MSSELPVPSSLSTWSAEELSQWAATSFGERTAAILKNNEVDGATLLTLHYEDFYHMQIPAGPRRKLLNFISQSNGLEKRAILTTPFEYKPFTVIKDLITAEDADKIREFFSTCPLDEIAKGSGYSSLVLNQRLYLPSLEEKIAKILPDMMIFATNYFGGDAVNGEYSGWHTGVNLSKLFVGQPNTMTLWIPLQPLTSETGGRLWFYNGEYLDSVIDILSKATDKKTMLLQYFLLSLMEKELEDHKVTDDVKFGEGFLFWELNPHCVDRECSIKRDVLSVRLISKSAVVDEDFLKEVGEFPEEETINHVEGKKMMTALYASMTKTKNVYDRSVEIINQHKGESK